MDKGTPTTSQPHVAACGRRLRERALARSGSPSAVPHELVMAIATEIEAHCGHHRLKCVRLALGWTVAEAVAAAHRLVQQESLPKIGLTERSWKDWEAGNPPSLTYQDLLCRLFTSDPVALGLARDYSPRGSPPHGKVEEPGTSPVPAAGSATANGSSGTAEVGPTKRRDMVKVAGIALASPALTARVLDQAAAEAFDFTQQAEATSLGAGTLDHLDHATAQFNNAYSLHSPRDLFDAVLDYRRKVARLLAARHTNRQGRELDAYAGWLSELLAWLAHDLGSPRAGLAFATDAFAHARQAGHDELCAWAMDAAASISLYAQQPDKARNAAEKGLSAAPTDHPLTVRLQAQLARACAARGDADGFDAAFRVAKDAYEQLPTRPPRCFGMDVAPLAEYALTSYPATSFIWLGRPQAAQRHAEQALTAFASAPAASRSPSREAIAHIDLGLAHAHLGDPDAAVALGHQALDSARVVESVRSRAADLATVLSHRYPRDSSVAELRERISASATSTDPSAPSQT
ncbi:XRE family transcriptional regulator [Streptomyces sp. NPDC003077]|uniref:XRE family transcriptional regulator n=1 Tax=Streptomyces sp. NPDC003077 TaxID=3154443 RepID=UPI0033B923ED